MSIYINGINLPKRGEEVYLLAVDSDGRVYNWRSEELPDCKALEVPPHGKLIEVDTPLFPTPHRKEHNDYMKGWNACLRSVMQQPTIIPADPEKGK